MTELLVVARREYDLSSTEKVHIVGRLRIGTTDVGRYLNEDVNLERYHELDDDESASWPSTGWTTDVGAPWAGGAPADGLTTDPQRPRQAA